MAVSNVNEPRVAPRNASTDVKAPDAAAPTPATPSKLAVKDTLDKTTNRATSKRPAEPTMPPVPAPKKYEAGPSVADVSDGLGTIGLGQKGTSVRQVQESLNAAGANPRLDVDGFFGPKTQVALDAFQKKSATSEGGVVGENTLHAFVAAVPPEKMEMIAVMELSERFQALGYLPKPPADITKAQFESGAQAFIKDHKDELDGVDTTGELFGLLDKMISADNGRRNSSGGQWSGTGSKRSGALPDAATYRSGPSRNQSALQQQAAQSISTNPPEAGSINARVAEATRNYMGTSTVRGPDGGNLACAWSVNNILANAGIKKVGSNTNYVPSVEAALKGGRGTQINIKDARPGDVVIFPNSHHIGIAMGEGRVANNSSSRAAFVNMGKIPAGSKVYRLNS